MIKLVAFDWNGTLASDTAACLYGFNCVLKALGKKPLSLKKWKKYFHVPVVETYVNSGVSRKYVIKNSKKLSGMFLPHYEKRAKHLRTRAGTKQALKWLHENKIETVIFSNHTKESIEHHLKRLKLDKYIKIVLANSVKDHSQTNKVRHKEAKLKKYIKRKKYKCSEVISTGDTAEEIEIGHELGTHTVGITGGYQFTSKIKKARPDFLISNMQELIPIVKKLNN